MRFNSYLFNSLFPDYYDYKMSVWKEVEENDSEMKITFVLPGYEKEDFSVYVENDVLYLTINRGEGKDITYSIGNRQRLYEYNLENTEVVYKSGILKITIPKKEVVESNNKIMIKVS